MKAASFLFMICIVLCACKTPHQWRVYELAGNYELQPKEKPLTEQLFTSSNVSGWDYDSPCNFSMALMADSTYEQSCNGGSFEMARYRGTWRISSDTVFLNPLFEVYGWDAFEEITALSSTSEEMLRIQSDATMEIIEMPLAEKGRILVRQ